MRLGVVWIGDQQAGGHGTRAQVIASGTMAVEQQVPEQRVQGTVADGGYRERAFQHGLGHGGVVQVHQGDATQFQPRVRVRPVNVNRPQQQVHRLGLGRHLARGEQNPGQVFECQKQDAMRPWRWTAIWANMKPHTPH